MSLKLPTIVETYIKYSIPNRITSDLLLKMLTWYINGGGGGTGGLGISNSSIKFNAILSGNLILQYTSDDTGFNGIFKYSLIKW